MGLLWDACGARAARAEGVARARDCETHLWQLQNTDAINHRDDFNHQPQGVSEGVKSPPTDAPDSHLRLFSKCISALCEFRAARSLSSNRPVCVNHKNISLLPWIPVWWDMISLGGGCLETLDPGRRKRSGGDVTFLWRVAPPSALRMRGHQTTWNEIFIFSCILCVIQSKSYTFVYIG